MSLENKIDFGIILSVKNANPNGDPLNGNRPRIDYDGYGEISDVCLKRKIRDRLQNVGENIFVQSDERKIDGMPNLRARAESEEYGLGKDAFKIDKTKPAKKDETAKLACKKWFDVRSFGQLFAFGKQDDASGVSIPIRGPVTIQSAFSREPVSITSTQIVKSVNAEEAKGKSDISSDRMGMKHRVDQAIYVTFGSMNPQLSEKTGFSNEDSQSIKAVLPKLFEGDASSARPEGSIAVEKVIWWQHSSKSGQYSSAKVHRTLQVAADGSFDEDKLKTALSGLKPEIIDGF
ncbi:MAG: type I-C CRISPR-associated protein Cas7/Csd2 [Thermodesulfobacteriota bacterium]|nr:type I-C CRISPR-associated protein Cas7/Csd2 [Thermodesulfobacteriota bacterium]